VRRLRGQARLALLESTMEYQRRLEEEEARPMELRALGSTLDPEATYTVAFSGPRRWPM